MAVYEYEINYDKLDLISPSERSSRFLPVRDSQVLFEEMWRDEPFDLDIAFEVMRSAKGWTRGRTRKALQAAVSENLVTKSSKEELEQLELFGKAIGEREAQRKRKSMLDWPLLGSDK